MTGWPEEERTFFGDVTTLSKGKRKRALLVLPHGPHRLVNSTWCHPAQIRAVTHKVGSSEIKFVGDGLGQGFVQPVFIESFFRSVVTGRAYAR